MSRSTKINCGKGARIKFEKQSRLIIGFEYHSPLNSTVINLDDLSVFRVIGKVSVKRGVLISLSVKATLEINDGTFINEGTKVLVYKECSIGKACAISYDVIITDSDVHQLNGGLVSKKVVIEDNVWIGFRSSIIKGAYVKSGSVIACHSLVRGTVERNTLNVGSPSKEIKSSIKWEM
jgi:acetyltransferase-like isoleucine patch superfamily enzyme